MTLQDMLTVQELVMDEVEVEGWRGVPDEEEDMGADGVIESRFIRLL
jgi:hypothetical protein